MPTNWIDLHGDHFRGNRVLVTGGAGFIGSHLSRSLVALGASVVCLDDLSGGERDNLEVDPHAGPGRLELIEGTILDEHQLKRAMARCRYVFHQAALPSVPRSIEMPRLFHEVNVTGSQILLDVAVELGVERVMFAASSSAYGDSEALPKVENMPPLPKSPYAANKLAGEHLMRAYASSYDLDTVSLRYFNIFGPRQNATSVYSGVIAVFAKLLLGEQQPVIHGDGEQSRDFTYVDNVVHANLLAARRSEAIGGEPINIACGERITINKLADTMARHLRRPHLQARHGPQRPGDVNHSLADLTRAREILGYEPLVSFERGLEATVRWYASSAVEWVARR